LSSPFDPHLQPRQSPNPFFEGWYTRLTDVDLKLSAAIIVGSYQPPQSTDFSENWLAFLFDYKHTMTTIQVFPKAVSITRGGQPVTDDPDPWVPAQFEYMIPEYGWLRVGNGTSDLNFTVAGYSIVMHLDHRVPWDRFIPDGPGPEGWLSFFPHLLPCHYYVETMGSYVTYAISNPSKQIDVKGSGEYGHQETNYGQKFPNAWVWASGTDGVTHFVLSGGRIVIDGKETETWVFAFRSGNMSMNFNSIDGDQMDTSLDPCIGVFLLYAEHMVWPYNFMDVNITFNVRTFSEPLYCPNATGFTNKPGAVESFQGIAKMSPRGGAEYMVYQSAIEFGGDYQCPIPPP